jgi:ankyrin repeat protein
MICYHARMKTNLLLVSFALSLCIAINASSQEPLNGLDKNLIQSAFDGKLKDVQALVTKGAAVDAVDPKKRTALMWAAANGHTAVVDFLHQQGADINARDSDGRTALIYATRRSYPPTVQFLLENGALPNVQSIKRGITALNTAAAGGKADIVRLLLAHGADQSVAEHDGTTALQRARENGSAEVISLLDAPPNKT